MINNQITDWFSEGKDYVEGVRLYLEFGQDKILKRLFTAEQRTDYKAARLERAMKDILKGTEVHRKDKKVPKILSQKSWPLDAAKDDVLRALRSEYLTMYREMQDLRSQLMLLANDDQRGSAAHRILDLDEKIDQVFMRRDYYLQHGKMPEKKSEDPEYVTDPLKQVDRMYTLQRYVRRENQYLKKDPGNVGAALRKKKFIEEYNYYAKRFGRNHIQEETEAGPATEK